MPLSITYKERVINSSQNVLKDSFKNFINTLRSVSEYRNAFIFLIAFFLFIDGVHTVIALASTFALNLGLDTSSIIIALILVQFVAFPSTLMWAFVAEKYGDKIVINITIIIYIISVSYTHLTLPTT